MCRTGHSDARVRLSATAPKPAHQSEGGVGFFCWKRDTEGKVVNFVNAVAGETRGLVKRQYWGKEQGRSSLVTVSVAVVDVRVVRV